MPETILVVDDDPVQRRLLSGAISKMGYTAIAVDSGSAALDRLHGPDAARISAMILDLVMPEMDGHAVLERLREMNRPVPVIVQTAQGGIETVVSAMRAGAYDFVVKPVSPERLQVSIANALKLDALTGEIKRIRKTAEGTLTFEDIVSVSQAMRHVLKMGEKAAGSQIPVLIEGESGVGKELIARAIQGSSARRNKPFVTVNCGALPENLVESILFGHEKGAFTGAEGRHPGKFREADGGTLFLDEVGELPLDMQVKLLRAIQEGEIDPVGARKPVKIDIRLISATNRDLGREVAQGRFREDLYYRLNVLPLTVPPLRDRREDVPVLAQHFLNRFAAEENRPHLKRLSAGASALLSAFDWPGNIRQLENAVFRAVVLAESDELTEAEFPQIAAKLPEFEAPEPCPEANTAMPADAVPPAASAASREGASIESTPYGQLSILADTGHVRKIEEIEADIIRLSIEIYRGRMSEVARRLGIGRSTLYRKLKDHELDDARSDHPDAA